MKRVLSLALAFMAPGNVSAYTAGSTARIEPVQGTTPALTVLPLHIGGRVEQAEGYARQWPGSYFETSINGRSVLFDIGKGRVALHVLVDDHLIGTLVNPTAGLYRIALSSGRHHIRVEVASESQAGPSVFRGYFAEPGTGAVSAPPRKRQIEFIGDSHTVGYGNTSPTQTCTEDEVWSTTDTSRSFAVTLAKRYGADYRVNAISGRGVVRNYNGFAGPTLPAAYPFLLLDQRTRDERRDWHPQVIVIALGTNDFSTPLHEGEPWKTREELHADFEAKYVAFVRQLRAQDPKARIVIWATNKANGEIEAEVAKVVATLRASGETRLTYAPIDELNFAACHSHPSLADEKVIADRLAQAIGTFPARQQ